MNSHTKYFALLINKLQHLFRLKYLIEMFIQFQQTITVKTTDYLWLDKCASLRRFNAASWRVCNLMWVLRLPFVENALLHKSHTNWLLWSFKCFFIALSCTVINGQIGHSRTGDRTRALKTDALPAKYL